MKRNTSIIHSAPDAKITTSYGTARSLRVTHGKAIQLSLLCARMHGRYWRKFRVNKFNKFNESKC